MIYVPNINDYQCVYVRNDSTIRAYKQLPNYNSTVDYVDYYYNSNYLFTEGQQQFSNYATLPTCLDNNLLTDNYYYRNDFPSILLMFFIISIFTIYLPFKILFRLIRRFN